MDRHADDGHRQRAEQGSDLLRVLLELDVLRIGHADLTSWLDHTTDPSATAHLINSIGTVTVAAGIPEETIDLFSGWVSTTVHPALQVQPHPAVRKPHAQVTEAARRALLVALVSSLGASSQQWQTVVPLTLAPRLTGKQSVDTADIGYLAKYIVREAESGHIRDAITHLSQTCTIVNTFKPGAARSAGHSLKSVASELVRAAGVEHYQALSDLARSAPRALAEHLVARMLTSATFAARARELSGILTLKPRMLGVGLFGEVLDHPHSRTTSMTPTHLALASTAPDEALRTCRAHLEQATADAYNTIRRIENTRNDHALGALFDCSRSTFRRLNAVNDWSIPGRDLCTAVDTYGMKRGLNFGLVALLTEYEHAEERKADNDSWLRRHQ